MDEALKHVPAHKRRKALQREEWLRKWWAFEECHPDVPRCELRRLFAADSRGRVNAKRLEAWELQFRRGGGVAGLVDGRGRPLTVRWKPPVVELLTPDERTQLAALLRSVADRLDAGPR